MQVSQAITPSSIDTYYSLFGEHPVDILNAFDTAAKTFASIGILIDGVRDELSRQESRNEVDSLLSSAGFLAMRHEEFLNQFSTSMQSSMEGVMK